MKKGLLVLGTSLLVLACSCATTDRRAAREIAAKNIAELNNFLAQPVEERFERAIAARDYRYLGIYDLKLFVPVVQVHNKAWPASELLLIPGTDSAVGKLLEEARGYASKYDQMLFDWCVESRVCIYPRR